MPGQTVGGKSVKSVNPRFCGVRWQSESASGDSPLAGSDRRELRGCTFAKSQSGVATSFCRRTPYNAASPNVYQGPKVPTKGLRAFGPRVRAWLLQDGPWVRLCQ